MKRILALLLVFLLPTACVGGAKTADDTAYRTDLLFSELTVSGEDAELEIAQTKELLFRIERGEIKGERAQKALDARTEAYGKLSTDAALAYVRYCLDMNDAENKRRFDALSVQLDALGCLLVDAALLLSTDPALSDRYDAETVKRLLREDALSDPSLLPLLEQERALEGRYEALSETLTIEYNGKRWTGDAILSDPTLSGEDFAALYEAYLKLFNETAGEIFLELIAVRNVIAGALGFASYADYRYACYGRDYTPEDAQRLCSAVREAFSPLLASMRDAFYGAAARLYGAVFEQKPTMERIREAIASIVPELEEPWDYMIAHGMYDLGADIARMPGSFTTYFASYGTPFLFGSWTNGFDSPPALIHEFGHFAALCRNGNASGYGTPPDLAEIDAQGLELLTVLRYDTVYGDLSDAAVTAELFYALWALLDGCLEDEFQQFAYGQETLTIERLNAEYGRLSAAYGLDTFGIEARSWTQIPHTFSAPFYYIGYTTGMAAALELYSVGTTDLKKAADEYRAIIRRTDGATLSETLKRAGLRDAFDADELLKTARELRSILRDPGN